MQQHVHTINHHSAFTMCRTIVIQRSAFMQGIVRVMHSLSVVNLYLILGTNCIHLSLITAILDWMCESVHSEIFFMWGYDAYQLQNLCTA